MKSNLKNCVKDFLTSLVYNAGKTRVGGYLCEQIINNVMNQVADVEHNRLKMRFAAPNSLNRFRVNTFSTKEPETLEWIDGFPNGATLWDIGANVGLYSIYAVKARQCNVYAFEPSVFNLELLARNAYLNGLTDQICLVPLALTDKLTRSKLNMTTTEWGGALSTFGQDFGWDGKIMKKAFVFQTLGLSMTDAKNIFNLPQPDYIKMDVDGIEHFILRGGREVLQKIKGILVEISDDFSEQATESGMILQKAGLTMKTKLHSEMFEGSSFQNTYNQIWYRA
jgi:FkbM family methyltransferase